MSKENKRQDLQVHIGNTLDDMGRRFIDAWHRAERGELTEDNAERHVDLRISTLSRELSPQNVSSCCATCIATLVGASGRWQWHLAGITGACMKMSKHWSAQVCLTETTAACTPITIQSKWKPVSRYKLVIPAGSNWSRYRGRGPASPRRSSRRRRA